MEVNDISEYQKQKGEEGEKAVFDALTRFINPKGFILHSYTYPMVEGLPGNIHKNEQGKLVVGGIAPSTELDIILVTQNFIYPIEIKTYSGDIQVTSRELIRPNNAYSDKSPVHQNEMHCRHLYAQLYHMIPDGKSSYIKPIVIFADKKCNIVEQRPAKEVNYIPVATITNAIKLIAYYEQNPNSKILSVKDIYVEMLKIGAAKREIKLF